MDSYYISSAPSVTANVFSANLAPVVALNFTTGQVSVDRVPPVMDRLSAAFEDLAQAVLDREALLRG